MADLTVLFEGFDCTGVRTYIQTGNIVFKATPQAVVQLAEDLPGRIERDFGFAPDIVTRTARQFRAVARAHPLAAEGIDAKFLSVLFLDQKPPAAKVGALDPERSPPDTFEVKGREVFACYPNGSHQSRLTHAYFEKTLGVRATARNWNTVQRLLAML